jgi:hypothetical protein
MLVQKYRENVRDIIEDSESMAEYYNDIKKIKKVKEQIKTQNTQIKTT